MLRQIIDILNKHSLIMMLLFCSLALSFCFSNSTYADDSITVTISGNPTITVAPTSEGTFADSGNINISVTNAPASGYTLAITGGGNTSLVGKTDSTKSITSITSAIDQATFDTSAYNNKWGYKPSMHYNTSTESRANNSNYLPSPDANGDIIDITDDNSSNNYTMSIGVRVTSGLGFQTYENNTFVISAVGNSSVLDCDSTKLCVEYEGNGLTYDGETLNRVNYNSTTTQPTVTKYSHTPNISDAGVQDGNYANSFTMNDVVTIDGATSLHIKLTYGGESASYDWVSFWAGNHPDYTAAGNYSTGVQNCGGGTVTNGKYGGTSGTTVECDVATSDGSVTFAFKSDSGGVGNGYGYYAIITGTGTVIERTVSSGEYATPTGTNPIFHGWSSTQTTPGGGLPSDVEYTNESEVMTKIPGDEGDTQTLYAVWQQGQPITFTKDSNVTKIDVLDSSGTTVGTITSSGQSLVLAQGDTYTIKPTHATDYTTNTITKTSGAGTLSSKEFTVGAGAATLNITSSVCPSMQSLTSSTIATLLPSTGSTATVCDARDRQDYTIAKLADGKYWMTENLNLAGGTALSSTDTDFESTYTLPTTGGWTTSSGKLVLPASSTSGFSENNYAYVYNSGNKENCGASGQNTPCYSYYSWDTATLGSGRSISTNDTDAPYSICPKGWTLPTSRTTSATNWQTTSDFYVLAHQYGLDSTTSASESDSDFYTQAGPGTLPNFLLAGFYYVGEFRYGGSTGYYWSSTSYYDANYARSLSFASSGVWSAGIDYRRRGYPVRCLFSS